MSKSVSIAFTCPRCGDEYGDPLYHGPTGHAPPDLCFSCWAIEWDIMARLISAEQDWRRHAKLLFLICQGFTQQEAASRLGIHRNTVGSRLRGMKKNEKVRILFVQNTPRQVRQK